MEIGRWERLGLPLLWVGKWVDQRAEGGLPGKGEGLSEVENHGFLVEPGTKEWMMDIITTGQSRPRRGLPRSLPTVTSYLWGPLILGLIMGFQPPTSPYGLANAYRQGHGVSSLGTSGQGSGPTLPLPNSCAVCQ